MENKEKKGKKGKKWDQILTEDGIWINAIKSLNLWFNKKNKQSAQTLIFWSLYFATWCPKPLIF